MESSIQEISNADQATKKEDQFDQNFADQNFVSQIGAKEGQKNSGSKEVDDLDDQNFAVSEKESDGDLNSKLKKTQFVMKNGCCMECMKAFSKNGKSCLCQVPKAQRRV